MKGSAKNESSISPDGSKVNTEDVVSGASPGSNFKHSPGSATRGNDKDEGSKTGEKITSNGDIAVSLVSNTENNRKRKRPEVSLRHLYLSSYFKKYI